MVTQFNLDLPAKNLPDAYSKAPDSNNAKILEIEKSAVDVLREAAEAIYESLDIDKAYGKTLDLYGDMIGQLRGAATDEQLLILIKNRIIRNLANGDHTSVVNAICATFGCDPSDVLLTELDEFCKVTLEGVPIAKLVESNIDIETAVQIVFGLMPVGVFVEAASFSGTFEFASGELEYDEKAGFGNEDQTVGGFLGYAASSGGQELPV